MIKQAVSLPSSPKVYPLSNATSAPCIKSSEVTASLTDAERDPMDPWELWQDEGQDTTFDDSWVRDGIYIVERVKGQYADVMQGLSDLSVSCLINHNMNFGKLRHGVYINIDPG